MTNINDEELDWFRQFVREKRAECMLTPGAYIGQFARDNPNVVNNLSTNISGSIELIRSHLWSCYQRDEARMKSAIIKYLILERSVNRDMLKKVFLEHGMTSLMNAEWESEASDFDDREDIFQVMSGVVADYSAYLSPYLYILDLSITQSRRSRAGKEFEIIIDFILESLKCNFESQSRLGTGRFNENDLRKVVDCVIPGIEFYENNRQKCAVLTAKTSLRERWSQIIEEMQRALIPHLYLLTVDQSVSSNTLNTMKEHNITLVTYAGTADKYSQFSNVISFERLFLHEIPDLIEWWANWGNIPLDLPERLIT